MRPLIQLPRDAHVAITGCDLTIKNHKVLGEKDLFSVMIYLARITHTKEQERFDSTKFEQEINSQSEPCDKQQMLDMIHARDVQTIIEDMTSQGIRFEAVIEYCVTEIRTKPHTLADYIWYNTSTHFVSWEEHLKFSQSTHGRSVAEFMIKNICDCKNWTEFFTMIKVGGKFRTEVYDKIDAWI